MKQKQNNIGKLRFFRDDNNYLLFVNLVLISIIVICACIWVIVTVNQIIEHAGEIVERTK